MNGYAVKFNRVVVVVVAAAAVVLGRPAAGQGPGADAVAAAPQLERIDLGNGLFQFALDPAIGTATPEWLGGAVEWEYVGQAVFSEDGERQDEFGASTAFDDDGATDTITRFFASEMVDEYGRLFHVRSIDTVALQAAIDAYDARIAEEFGYQEPQAESDLYEASSINDEATDEDEEGGKYFPLKWYREDQDGDRKKDLFRWDEDDRDQVQDPLTSRQEKTVIYSTGSGGNAAFCTGVLVGDNWVLTAAHCGKIDENTWRSPLGEVCLRGAGHYDGPVECATVTAAWSNGNWGGSGDMGDDIVILKINANLGAGNYMALSSASNSTLKDHDAYNIGYPGIRPNGSGNLYSCSGATPNRCKARMYWDAEEVNKTSKKIIGTKVDMSSGHSGGPIFYYPNGVGENAAHYLTGIVSGHHNGGTKSYNGAAKIPYHKDWILGIID